MPQDIEELMWVLRTYRLLHKACEDLWMNCNPLNDPTKKNSFVWNEAIEYSFSALKEAMCTTPVLEVPYFTKTFVLECDACLFFIN
jgi:hypothetical protein